MPFANEFCQLNTPAKTTDTLEDVDLRALLAMLWAGRWWIVVSVALVTGAFAATAFLMTPVYRATAVLVPADADRSGMGALGPALSQFGGLAALAGINMNSGNSATEESLAVLRSREFTESFIRDQRLMPELFHKKWDKKANDWKGDLNDRPTLAQAYKYFDRHVRVVSLDKKTGLVSLQIEWKDADKAAAWANELVARLNSEMRSREITRTNASVGYLEKELAATSAIDTRQAINRLMEAQINQRMVANVTKEYALRVVDRAMPADKKDVVRPRKLIMIVMGTCVGLLAGILSVFMFRRTHQ